jgi:hypothetical protein
MIHQESLFFVLPFFSSPPPGTAANRFSPAARRRRADVDHDPLYYKWLAPKRSLFLALHTLTLFAALLTALPIILHLTTAESYKLASASPWCCRFRAWRSACRCSLGFCCMAAPIGCAGWFLRSWVHRPPVDDRVAISTQLQDRTPGDDLKKSAPTSCAVTGCTPTPRSMPRGLDERIYHVAIQRQRGRPHRPGYPWRRRLPRLDPQAELPRRPVGRWQVRVLTEDGQVIGVLRFKVTDAQTDNPK